MPPPGISRELFERLDIAADAINPALTLWALLVLWRVARQARARGEAFAVGRTLGLWLGCILVVYVVAHLNRWLDIWPGEDGRFRFPSGHTSYAACVATLGASLDRRSLVFSVPLLLVYSTLIVLMGYHVWIDIVGALILGPLLTVFLLRRFAPRRVPVAIEGPIEGPVR